MSTDDLSQSSATVIGTDKSEGAQLTPQQRGALIRHSGRSPIASLRPQDRTALLQGVLLRYLDDEELRDIAQDIGISMTGLYQAMMRWVPEEWQAAQGARALLRMEDAERALEAADNMVAVTRSGHLIRSQQWMAERTLRRLYGDNVRPDTTGKVSITLNLGSGERVVDDADA